MGWWDLVRVFAVQAWGSQFESQHLHKKQCYVHTYNPSVCGFLANSQLQLQWENTSKEQDRKQ